jgi:hypothetical protein
MSLSIKKVINMRNIEKLAEKKMENILLDGGYVEFETIKRIMTTVHTNGMEFLLALLDEGIIDEETIAYALCNELQLPFISLENYYISPELMQTIPKNLMVKYKFVPIERFENALNIAVGSTFTREMIKEIQEETKSTLFIYISTISSLKKVIDDNISAEEKEALTMDNILEEAAAQVTAGWESIFDVADRAVMDEIKQKAEESSDFNISGSMSSYQSGQFSGSYTKEYEDSSEHTQMTIKKLNELAQRLIEDPLDSEAVNDFVASALSIGDLEAALNQILQFAENLENADDEEGAINCYQYILDLDPDNQIAQEYLANHGL